MRSAFALLSRFIPMDLPSRLRLMLLTIGIILLVTVIPIMVTSNASPWLQIAVGVLYAVIAIRWSMWYRGAQPTPYELVLELIALGATTLVVASPTGVASVLFALVMYRACYSSVSQLTTTLVLANAVFLASVAIFPNNDHMLTITNVLGRPPLVIVVAVVVYGLTHTINQHHALLEQQQQLVTRQNDLLVQVNAAEHRFRSLVEGLPGAILTSTPSGEIRYVSPHIETMLGFPVAAFQTNWMALVEHFVHVDDRARMFAVMRKAVVTGNAFTIEFRARTQTGDIAWIFLDSVLVDDGSPDSPLWRTLIFDVTELHTLTEQLTHQAFHDALTGLPNRQFFKQRVDEALERSAVDGFLPAVCFIDLDNFKNVNDTLGHTYGDLLVIEVGQRLRACVRQGDTVARLGGDEFALLLVPPSGRSEIARVVDRILVEIAQPFMLDGHPVETTASIGIAVAERSGSSRSELIRRADVAMYAAKRHGKSRCAMFEPGMDSTALQHTDLAVELRNALEDNALRIAYQPIVDLNTGAIHEVEALMRWLHPVRGLLAPAEFLPTAEETGLIVPIGRWILHAACQQIVSWQQTIPGATNLSLSVNLSPRQLQDAGLVTDIARALQVSGLDPRCLQLEISERTMLADIEQAVQATQELTALGVRIAIDDFGTGNSSLGHLCQLPVHTLKIDRSYVMELGASEQGATMLRAMVTLGKTLGMDVTAEGVETIEQTAIRTFGCDYGQGYYFARPLFAAEMMAMLVDGVTFPVDAGQRAIAAVTSNKVA